MNKLIRALSLMTVLALLAGGTVAQDKKKDDKKADDKKTEKKADDKKKDEKKDDKKADEKKAGGSVEIYKGAKGYRFRVKNADGKVIAMPLLTTAWETKDEALKAIEDLKEALKAKPVDVKD